jgi:hypothetical protein
MSGLRCRDQVRRSIGSPLDASWPDDRTRGYGKALRRLGFARIRSDHLLEVLGEPVAAWPLPVPQSQQDGVQVRRGQAARRGTAG